MEKIINIIAQFVGKKVTGVHREIGRIYIMFEHGYIDDDQIRVDRNGVFFTYPFSDAKEENISKSVFA